MSWVQPVLINLGAALIIGLSVNFGLRALIPYLRRKGYFQRPGSKQTRSSAPLLIREAHVLVGDGGVLNDVDILIEQGNITRIESSRIDVPGARVIEARGKTVMPGLIDAHCHLDFLNARSGFSARMQARFGLSEPTHASSPIRKNLLHFRMDEGYEAGVSEPGLRLSGFAHQARAHHSLHVALVPIYRLGWRCPVTSTFRVLCTAHRTWYRVGP